MLVLYIGWILLAIERLLWRVVPVWDCIELELWGRRLCVVVVVGDGVA